jgi:hypothetical protein
MQKIYKNLWAIAVHDERLGEIFAEYTSAGHPPIDRNRTVLCGEENLAKRILELGEYWPKGRNPRIVPVVVHIKDRDTYDAEVNQSRELFDRPTRDTI